MEAKEPPLTYLYQYVEQYRQEMNITPMQWYISNMEDDLCNERGK